MPDGKSAVQISARFLVITCSAIAALFTVLIASYESRISEVKIDKDKAVYERDSTSKEYTRVLRTWNAVSKEKDDSYSRLMIQQKEDNYRRIDSLMEAIFILKYNSNANRELLRSNRELLKKAVK